MPSSAACRYSIACWNRKATPKVSAIARPATIWPRLAIESPLRAQISDTADARIRIELTAGNPHAPSGVNACDFGPPDGHAPLKSGHSVKCGSMDDRSGREKARTYIRASKKEAKNAASERMK